MEAGEGSVAVPALSPLSRAGLGGTAAAAALQQEVTRGSGDRGWAATAAQVQGGCRRMWIPAGRAAVRTLQEPKGAFLPLVFQRGAAASPGQGTEHPRHQQLPELGSVSSWKQPREMDVPFPALRSTRLALASLEMLEG